MIQQNQIKKNNFEKQNQIIKQDTKQNKQPFLKQNNLLDNQYENAQKYDRSLLSNNSSFHNQSHSQVEIPLSQYRYINFIVFILAALVNSIPTQAFSGINSLVQNQFGYSPIIVTLNTLVFSLLHPIAAFPVNWILDAIGMKFGCVIGSIVLIAGVWLRSFIQVQQPALCLLGSALSAFGNIFIMNSPSKLATQWFNHKTIPVIISIAVLTTNMSLIIGGIIPGLFLSQKSTADQIKQFFFVEAIIVSVPMLIVAIFLKQKPKINKDQHQNQSHHQHSNPNNNHPKQSYIQTLKDMFSNKEYLKIMLITMFSFGNIIAFIANLNQQMSVLKYQNPPRIFLFTLLGVSFTGIISTIGASYVLRKTLAYRKVTIILILGSFFTFIGLAFVLCFKAQSDVLLLLSACCFGFFILPSPSVLMSYASQSVFPLGQASSSGYQYAGCQTFGFILGVSIITFIRTDQDQKQIGVNRVYWVYGVQSFLFLIAGIFAFLTKQDLRRHKHHIQALKKNLIQKEKKNKNLNKSISDNEQQKDYDNQDIIGNYNDEVNQLNDDDINKNRMIGRKQLKKQCENGYQRIQ